MWRATEESPRLFDSDLVDGMSRVPWYVVPAVWMPVVAASIGWSLHVEVGALATVGQFGLGVFVWTLLEYWLHRTLFHWVPDAAWGERFHFLMHGVHHHHFKDHLRLVMPPAASMIIAVFTWSALTAAGMALTPWVSPSWKTGVFAGIVFGYVVYDLIHYHLHHGRPLTRADAWLRAHHNKHHHNPKYAEKKFGVSSTVWDHVFRTYE